MTLEQAKYQNEEYILRGKYRSEEQKSALINWFINKEKHKT